MSDKDPSEAGSVLAAVFRRLGVGASLVVILAAGVIPLSLAFSRLLLNGRNIGSALGTFTATASGLVGFSAAIGLLTMAVVEVAKRLMPLRGYFQRWRLNALFGYDLSPLALSSSFGNHRTLPYGRSSSAWFDVPADQLVAQLGALVEPRLDRLLITLSAEPGSYGAGQALPDYLLLALLGFWSDKEFGELVRREPERRSRSEDSRLDQLDATVRGELERSLDRLHLAIESDWRLFVRALACAVAAALGAVILATDGPPNPLWVIVLAIGTSVVAGFFSWLARDVVAVITSFRPS